MLAQMTSYFQTISKILQQHPFSTGFMSGILLVLLLLLLILISRTRRISSVSFLTERGSVSIGTAAVAALIGELEKGINGIRVRKVFLYRKQRRVFLKIVIDFNASAGNPLPEAAALLQTEALHAIRDHFGIRDIDQVLIQVRRSHFSSKKGVPARISGSDGLDGAAQIAEPDAMPEQSKPQDWND